MFQRCRFYSILIAVIRCHRFLTGSDTWLRARAWTRGTWRSAGDGAAGWITARQQQPQQPQQPAMRTKHHKHITNTSQTHRSSVTDLYATSRHSISRNPSGSNTRRLFCSEECDVSCFALAMRRNICVALIIWFCCCSVGIMLSFLVSHILRLCINSSDIETQQYHSVLLSLFAVSLSRCFDFVSLSFHLFYLSSARTILQKRCQGGPAPVATSSDTEQRATRTAQVKSAPQNHNRTTTELNCSADLSRSRLCKI